LKKFVALVTMFAFIVALSGLVYAKVDDRSPAEKLEAARAYLKLLDQKIIRLRNEGKLDLVKKMQADKKGTLARMKAWKAEAEAEEGAPGAPVAPTPPAPPLAVRPAATPSAGLFGWGLSTDLSGSYISTGSGSVSGVLGVRGDLVLADPLALGTLVGLSENDVKYHIGLGYSVGNSLNAIPLYIDGVIALPADLLGGIASYLGGGLNYTLYGNGRKIGRYGIEAYYGVKGNLGLGLGGDTAFELGYSVVRSDTVSKKGITLSVVQEIVL
jgi:hypothetical protein